MELRTRPPGHLMMLASGRDPREVDRPGDAGRRVRGRDSAQRADVVDGDCAPTWGTLRPVLLLAIVGFGLFAGAVAQLVLGTGLYGINWTEAIVAGLVGSFVGGMLLSILAGDGVSLRPSGLIGSIIGAIVVLAAYRWYRGRRRIA
jgi:uncharacterized membrane protein YeaQ/YmgE (transglycosylase-associated protein family)